MHPIQKLWGLVKRTWDLLDICAQMAGGWPIFGALLMTGLTALWAILADLGPLSIILGLYVAALAMIVFTEGQRLLERWRRASAGDIAKAAHLSALTEEGVTLRARLLCATKDDIGEVESAVEDWVARVLVALEGEPYEEYYGFQSMPMAGKPDKLRLITMRLIKSSGIRTSDVLRFRREQSATLSMAPGPQCPPTTTHGQSPQPPSLA